MELTQYFARTGRRQPGPAMAFTEGYELFWLGRDAEAGELPRKVQQRRAVTTQFGPGLECVRSPPP